jgi:ribonuclease H2 subunit C
MSTTKIQLNSSATEKEIAVHVLPCHIAYDGPSKVSSYFQPRQDPDDRTQLTCALRGRKLRGLTLSLPNHYSGITLLRPSNIGHVFLPADTATRFDRTKYEDDDEEDEAIEKSTWQSDEKFNKLTIWEHQALPDRGVDPWIKGIEEWIPMADVVPQFSNSRWQKMNAAGYDTSTGNPNEN